MKNFIILMSLTLASTISISSMAQEELTDSDSLSTSCNGYAQIPGNFVTLSCNNGYCSGWLSPQYISVSGSCGQAGNFQASTYLNSGYISGSCNGSTISIFSTPGSVSLSGTCSTNGSFSGSMSLNSSWATGSCQPNGTSSVYFSGSSASIYGNCNN